MDDIFTTNSMATGAGQNTSHTTPNMILSDGSTYNPPQVSNENLFSTPNISPTFDASSLSSANLAYPPTEKYGYSLPQYDYSNPYEEALPGYQSEYNKSVGAVDSGMATMDEVMRKIGGKSAREMELGEQMGLTSARQEYDALGTEYQSIKNALNQAKADTTGLTREQANMRDINLNREANFKLTDLEIRRAVMNGNISKLEASLEKRLENEFGPLETELKIRERYFEMNKDKMSTAEQRLFTINQKRMETDLSNEKENREAINDIIKTATENGIILPDNIVRAVNNAGNARDAYLVLQRAGVSLAKPKTSGGEGYFTSSQTNAGVARSGLDRESFLALPYAIQNLYINPPKVDVSGKSVPVTDIVQSWIRQASEGKLESTEVEQKINSSRYLSPSAKEYFVSQIPQTASGARQPTGFFGNLINKVTSWI